MRDISYVPQLTRRTSRLRDDGVTAWALRGEQYETPFRGLRRPAGISIDQPATRIADALGLMTDGCVLTGWASRWLQGQAYCDGERYGKDLPVTFLCGPGARLRRQPGTRPRERRWVPGEVVDLDDVVVATIARAAYDDMLDAPNRIEALVAVEMATSTIIEQARTAAGNVRAVFDAHVKTRGRVQARWALAHLSTRSASPWETRTRVLATETLGIETWHVNVPVFDQREKLLGIPDLLDPDSGLVIESDGGDHRDIGVHNADNVREEALENHGSAVVRIGSAQLSRSERPETRQRLRLGFERAHSMGRQTWTTEKPAWWRTWPPGRRWD
ncbi:hypothetical protein [Solicola gregarius]|uniref:DUF559 domain-containing protein n=1 Tax=Solicola gregarius TaxID=2908642 RepID=A0AA46YJL6_9ACTN|nr:hypothetical protein [Solicola gregarius]UYM03719.1 hypothetical protein L0C25_14340 [Solicola gregarius]